MKLNLTTRQREWCVGIIGAIGGANAVIFRKAVKLLDILELTDADKEVVGYVNDTRVFEGDLSSLKSRVGVDVESAWINGENGTQMQRPGDIFITARIPTGQKNWEDKEHLWLVDIVDGNLITMLKEQVAAFGWPRGFVGNKEWQREIIDLLDQLGIDGE